MRHGIIAVLFLSLTALATVFPATQQDPRSGSIEGRVLFGSNQPMPGASVTLSGVTNSGPISPETLQTDEQGRFAFRNLATGFYTVNATAEGYVMQFRSSAGAVGISSPGQSIKNLEMRMARAGFVTGRTVNTAGQPLAGIEVTLMKSVYDRYGRRTFASRGTATTNDRGEYRITASPYTRYILVARAPYVPNGKPAEKVATEIYPGVSDEDRAAAVEVRVGDSTALKDFALALQPPYSIRGRVVDGVTGRPPAQASVWITPTSLPGDVYETPKYDPANGTFEVHNVIGLADYVMGVTIIQAPSGRPLPIALPPEAKEATIRLTNNIEGMAFTVFPAVTLGARLSVDSQSLSSLQGWETVRVQLKHSRYGIVMDGLREPLPQLISASATGMFTMGNVMPGEFRLSVTGLPADAYVKEARIGSTDILNQPIVFAAPPQTSPEIVLGAKGGRIDGTAVNDSRQPASGVQAVLIRDQHRDRPDLYKTAVTDASGRFTLRGIAPGDYKLFCWRDADPFAWFDHELLKLSEMDAKPMRVTAGSSSAVELRAISIGQ